jgi:hypothetical protein
MHFAGAHSVIRHGSLIAVPLLAAAVAACGNSGPTPTLTQAELMDPVNCQKCHAEHFTEWSGSMHAYSGTDPLFLAMNARGQRETNKALGTFCVKCHAPMAVALGTTTDGTNLSSLPPEQTAVTCYFCHSATAVTDSHDAPITLATDSTLRASIRDPVANTGHKSSYEALLDRSDPSSATLCGSCHDIVNMAGVHLERTFEEWKGTLFSQSSLELTCGGCHMDGTPGLAAQYPGVPTRRVHAHTWPGVDTALTPGFPQTSAQQTAVQTSLDATLQAALCVKGMSGQATVQVVLENVGAGHAWPSGATQDRRAWVEVQAFSGGQPIYSSGVVADGQSVIDLKDPDLWLIRDCIFDATGSPVHMFWQAASHDSNQLPGPVTNMQTDPRYYLTHVVRNYPQPTSTPSVLTTLPDKVTMRVRLVPVGLDVLDDLIQSGDLDPSVKARMPTYDLGGTTLTWTAATATIKYPDQGLPVSCVTSGLSTGASTAVPAPAHTNCSP